MQLLEGDVAAVCSGPVPQRAAHLNRCYLETDSYWPDRSSVPVVSVSNPPVPAEIRVYPNLWEDRKTTAALFLRRDTYGVHAHRQIGKGREFEKLRDYIPGDGFDEIHWKATAKRGVPVTKVFQVERTQEVYLVLDASRLSSRPAPRNSGQAVSPPMDDARTTERADHPKEVSAGGPGAPRAASAPSDSSDKSDPNGIDATTTVLTPITAGLLGWPPSRPVRSVVGDRVREFIRARHGKQHFAACRTSSSRFSRRTSRRTTDIASFIRLRLRKRAPLIVLTNLTIRLAEQFVRSMDLIRRQHLDRARLTRQAPNRFSG